MGAKQSSFKKKVLAASISSCLLTSAGAVYAQDRLDGPAPTVVEEVQVIGIRASLQASMDVKRDSSGVVDAITSEDIGKFPDTNLAESLQRITGVSINREDGEGALVSVRGFGPNDNLITHNGRFVASTRGERGFNFANLASEMVMGVAVHKTSEADLMAGSGGALINISSRRPLNNPGQTILGSIKGVIDNSGLDTNVTPEVTGIYSNTFADDTVGVSVGLSYQERENGQQVAWSETGYRAFPANTTNDGNVPMDDTQVNRPQGENELFTVPQDLFYQFREQQRERVNGQLVLQWAPADNVTTTLDLDYFRRNVATQHWESSVWFTYVPSQAVWTDGPVAAPLIYSESYASNQDVSASFRDSATQDEGMTIGFNVDWEVNDALTLNFDVARSTAEQSPDSPWGSNNKLSTAAFVRTSATADFTGDFPAIAVGGIENLSDDDYFVTGSWFNNTVNEMDVNQAKVDGNFQFDDSHGINFGVAMFETTNRVQSFQVQRNDWGGVGRDDPAAQGALQDAYAGTRRNALSEFDGSSGNFSAAEQLPGVENGILTADGTDLNQSRLDTIWMVDFNTLRSLAEGVDTQPDGVAGDCGTQFCASTNYQQPGATNRETTEETVEAYVQYVADFVLADMPINTTAGLRYVSTDVHSESLVPTYDGISWDSENEFVLSGGDVDFDARGGSYTKVLPSISFNIEPMQDVIVRAAVSQSIMRPQFVQLQGGIDTEQVANRFGATAESGNPALNPRESDNFDLSVEWYYNETSYVSLGYFYKNMSNLIQRTTDPLQLGLRNPATGSLADQAREALGDAATGAQIRTYIAENFPAHPSVTIQDDGSVSIAPVEDSDPLPTNLTSYSNSDESRRLNGVEFNVQHMFGESGFGAIFNYTAVDSNADFDLTNTSNQTVIDGISDTMNIVGFYENYGASIRLAYNWRDSYLTPDQQNTGQQEPIFADTYGQWDLDVSYTFSDNTFDGLRVYLQGINITDESNLTYGRNAYNIKQYTETGARWQLGATYTY